MSRIRLLAVAVVLCGLAAASTARAQDKNGPNLDKSPKAAKVSDKTKALQDLELASRLINYGRANKHAESLLVAAQIIHNTPTAPIKATPTIKGEKGNAAAPAKVDNSPKALVAEANKLSNTPAVKTLAAATMQALEEQPRGRLGGPGVDTFTIYPGQTISWPTTFIGGQNAVVDIDMRGVFGVMTLAVYDQNGNLVARDTVPGTYYNVRWQPLWTGRFTIRLTNRDSVAFRCVMRTN